MPDVQLFSLGGMTADRYGYNTMLEGMNSFQSRYVYTYERSGMTILREDCPVDPRGHRRYQAVWYPRSLLRLMSVCMSAMKFVFINVRLCKSSQVKSSQVNERGERIQRSPQPSGSFTWPVYFTDTWVLGVLSLIRKTFWSGGGSNARPWFIRVLACYPLVWHKDWHIVIQ